MREGIEELRAEMKIPTERMSTRAQNALKNAGVVSYGDLKALTVDDLYRIKNVGRKTVNELRHLFGDFLKPKVIDTSRPPLTERELMVYKMRKDKKLFKEIAKEIGGVSTSRARAIYCHAEHRLESFCFGLDDDYAKQHRIIIR